LDEALQLNEKAFNAANEEMTPVLEELA